MRLRDRIWFAIQQDDSLGDLHLVWTFGRHFQLTMWGRHVGDAWVFNPRYEWEQEVRFSDVERAMDYMVDVALILFHDYAPRWLKLYYALRWW